MKKSFFSQLPHCGTQDLEKKLFESCERRITKKYKRRVRSIIFLFKDETIQEKFKREKINSQEILSRCS